MAMRHVIVGAGPAGVIAAETLRAVQPESEVVLLGDEPEPPYSRMALPYYLSGKIDESGTYLRSRANPAEHYRALGIDLRQDRAASLDTERRSLRLESGEKLGYDRLLMATGAVPLSPPIPGIDLPGVLNCWTMEDARGIATRAAKGAEVVLMGAGFIGCIILESLVRRGVRLSVIEMGDRMVPRMMDQVAGGLLKRWCGEKGLQVHTSTRVTAIRKGGKNGRLEAVLEDGSVLPADLIISATGVKPAIDLLKDSRVETDFGVLVDQRLQSNIEGIYAAGDVCQGKDFSTGQYSVQAIQPTAAEHGRIAAMNMAGKSVLHQGSVNMNVLDTLGLISSSFGLWDGAEDGEEVKTLNEGGYRYLNLQFSGDHLVGAQALGLTNHVGVLRGLIQTRVRLGPWKQRLLEDPTAIMEAYLGCVQPIGYNASVLA